MKRSIDPVLNVAKAATATVLLLALASPAWAETPIKSTKSNTSDRVKQVLDGDQAVVKGSKSNSSEVARGVDKTDKGKAKIAVSDPDAPPSSAKKTFNESRSNSLRSGDPKDAPAAVKLKTYHDSPKSSINNIR